MNQKVITNEDYEELSGYVEYLGSRCNRQEEEIRYMHDFINWMHLESMYAYFRRNAHEFQPADGSFSYFTLDDKHETQDIVCS